MMKLLVAGAGGHGRVVADAALASGIYSVVAFVDDRWPEISVPESWPVVGKLDALPALVGEYDAFVAAFGAAAFRLEVLGRAAALGFGCPAVVHPRATISALASIGDGSVAFAGAVVNTGARIGAGCIINSGATVDHDCELGEGAHVCPGAHLAGNVVLGPRSWFGIGAVAKQGIRIGADVMVGAGSVVVRDVADNATVVGNPARELAR